MDKKTAKNTDYQFKNEPNVQLVLLCMKKNQNILKIRNKSES